MAESEEKNLNDAISGNKPEESGDLFTPEDVNLGQFDLGEDELELGDDYIASALALLENYPDKSELQIDIEPVQTGEIQEGKPEGSGLDIAVMEARIGELETTVNQVRSQAKKKLEGQAQVLHEANRLIQKLREQCNGLEKRLAEEAEASEEHKRKWQETVASYLNYQKQSKKKLGDFVEIEKAKILRQFLPVIDDFRRSTDYETPSESLLQGIKLVYKQFDTFIRNLGVRPIPALGEPFDPYNHEAINRIPVDEGPSNVVIEELQVGYFLDDKVLRPSKVSVSFRTEEKPAAVEQQTENTEEDTIEPTTEGDEIEQSTEGDESLDKDQNQSNIAENVK